MIVLKLVCTNKIKIFKAIVRIYIFTNSEIYRSTTTVGDFKIYYLLVSQADKKLIKILKSKIIIKLNLMDILI